MTNEELSRELDGVSITAIATGLLDSRIMMERCKKNFPKAQNDFSTLDKDDEESEANLRKFLGARIKVMRTLRGLTQTELAKRLGATQSLVTNYETGRREPGIRYLLKLSRILNVSVDWLIGTPPLKPE